MEYTVQKMAELAGVSGRTLRWYDKIGLLKPLGKTEAGYRLYGEREVARLQQILFYRQAGFSLGEIGRLLDDPNHDAEKEMREHLGRLLEQREQLEKLIANAEKTWQTMKGEKEMSDKERFEGFKKELVRENEEKYGDEIRQKYGETQVDAANARMLRLSEEEYRQMQQTEEELKAVLRQAVQAAGEQEALEKQAVALHKKWLCYTWPQYSAKAHRGLAEMYQAEERFSAYYDAFAPGAAAFLCRAIQTHAEDMA